MLSFLLLSAFAALMSVRDLPHSAVVPMSILADRDRRTAFS